MKPIKTSHSVCKICYTKEWILREIEIMDDHLHLMIQTDHKTAPVEIVQTIKSLTAIYIFQKISAS